MAYQVNRYNGQLLASVPDGTINETTDIRLVGKNYAGYGQVQNENFLHLLENFSGSKQPSRPISGQLWFDNSLRKIKVFDGSVFKTVGGATSTSSPPTGLSAGEFWFDSSSQQLYCWNGTEFTLIGPENPVGLGDTSISTQVVTDTTGTRRSIAKLKSGGQVMAVISKDSFTLNLSLLGPTAAEFGGLFTEIKKGITLAGSDSNGVSYLAGPLLWGTAQTSHALIDTSGNLFDPNSFVKSTESLFTSRIQLQQGLTLGSTNRFTLAIDTDNTNTSYLHDASSSIQPLVEGHIFKSKVSSSETRDILRILPTGLIPGQDIFYNLGSSNRRWNQLHVNNVEISENLLVTGEVRSTTVGNHKGDVLRSLNNFVMVDTANNRITADVIVASSQFEGRLNGTATTSVNSDQLAGFLPDITASANTIVRRDASGNITANNFFGTAQLADRIKIDNSAVDTDLFYRSAKTTKTANSIAARDSAGDLSANVFRGTATAVLGADLAEKYLADGEYDIGTVMSVGGPKEIRPCNRGDRAFSVVSANAGYIMNTELHGGVTVALKGRVPVKVIGIVHKGDRLVADSVGVAKVAEVSEYHNVFAIALEDSNNLEVKLVESVVL
jgi:hypothetical protein